MESIIRSKSKTKNQQIFNTKHQIPPPRPRNLSMCKKHPKHQQSPGVCSVCLNEKLKKLSNSSSRRATAADDHQSSCSSSSLSSLSSSSHYSASASSNSSPLHHRHYRLDSEGRGFSMTLFKSGKNVLTKSRSVAFITRRRETAGREIDHEKKKGGFWSKLLLRPNRSKKINMDAGGLALSGTMNERRVTAEVH
ncbi:OLC1v1017336C1 [Oldenlandia corymbosa var. corymbosa]|uniref:OLC1v1017336C1 n=1 Tax=Oldenlandia corymbosa var. corymbosa TaxID=529605 RepID=A0AAV1E984_OLDCO|nr:OLC1v1017336C1 [Oldenlandia corymbosa var. corymbosa]